MGVSALAARLGVARTTASLLVAGLVDRREDVDDHRRTMVAVSQDSRSEVRQTVEARLAPLRRAAQRLGPARVAELTAGLMVLAEELRGESCDDAGAGTR
jgi:DNA-binding MarR family transcriptional regulator